VPPRYITLPLLLPTSPRQTRLTNASVWTLSHSKSSPPSTQEFKDELKKGQDEMEAEQKAKAAADAAKPATPVTPEVLEEKKE